MTDRKDEFEGRPALSKKRAITRLLGESVKYLVVALILACLMSLLVNAKVGADSRKILLDCTRSTGECAHRNQERTANLIQQLISNDNARALETQAIVVAAVTCARLPGNDTLVEVQVCVDGIIK